MEEDQHRKKKMAVLRFLEEQKHMYNCRFCGYRFNAEKSFVCPQCKRTN